jgi:hypothetical protein
MSVLRQAISANLLHHPGQFVVHLSQHQMALRNVTTAGPLIMSVGIIHVLHPVGIHNNAEKTGIQHPRNPILFSTGPRQVSLLAVADHDTNKANLLTPVDWDPILDNGCRKSAGRLENVISLSMALDIPIHLSALY